MNLPNKLTLFRIFLIPVFIIIMMLNIPNKFLIACMIFIVASATDAMDGYIARKYNLVTDFGKFMDPLADKLLVISALTTMIEFDLAASSGGKLKTISQMIAIIVLLLGKDFGSIPLLNIGKVTILIATLLTLYSGWEYLYKNKNLFMESK